MNGARRFLKNLSLSQRFTIAGLVIMLAGGLGIAAWVENQIVNGVIHSAGVTTALYVDSFVAPVVQELGESEELLPENRQALERLLLDTPMGQQIVAIKIWNTRGKLLFHTNPAEIGKSFPMHEGLLRARLGEVVSELSELDRAENQDLGLTYDRLLETYSPIWLSGTNRVIAVAEFYQATADLDQELAAIKQRTWLVVFLAITLIYLLLVGFVRGASNTIQRQQGVLSRQVVQLTDLLGQNRELSERVRRASASVAQLNESYLKRIGSDLHDGPAQNLGVSILKLDALTGRLESAGAGADVTGQMDEIQASLQGALKEMRAIAAGLSLPQLNDLDLEETVIHVVRTHERRTGKPVELELELDALPDRVALPLRITVYRLIQEALNNAFRHAGGAGQRVRVGSEGGRIVVEISDSGPGFDPRAAENGERLGLGGMRERVESLGGSYAIDSRPGQGTTIIARLPGQGEGEETI